MITLIAFKYFQEQEIEWGIIEVGIGGRLDPTNILNSEMSVICSVGLDHQAILGETVELIAFEKAAIIKGNPYVVGPHAPHDTIGGYVDETFGKDICKGYFLTKTFDNFQDENNETVGTVLEHFGLEEDSINRALSFNPACRFETLHQTDDLGIVLDVCHNPQAWQ